MRLCYWPGVIQIALGIMNTHFSLSCNMYHFNIIFFLSFVPLKIIMEREGGVICLQFIPPEIPCLLYFQLIAQHPMMVGHSITLPELVYYQLVEEEFH